VAALVKPEYGPSLPELAGPRLRALPRWVLWAAVGASVLLVALAFAGWLVVRTPTRTIKVKEPVAFSVTYPSESLERLPASGTQVVRLASPAGTPNPVELEFSRIELPAGVVPTEGSREAVFPLVSSRLIEQMRRDYPDFVVRGEQAVNYGGQAGYQIYYQTERDGKTWYGRRTLLFSDNLEDNVGVDVNALALRPEKGGPMTVWEVAQADPLLRTLRSVKLASQ
jgi:hypothetical protein